MFVGLQMARLMAESDELANLFLRVSHLMLRMSLDAEEAQKRNPGTIEHPDERLEGLIKQLHGPRQCERNHLAPLQRQRLRREFSEHDVQIGNDGESDDSGGPVRRQVRELAGQIAEKNR